MCAACCPVIRYRILTIFCGVVIIITVGECMLKIDLTKLKRQIGCECAFSFSLPLSELGPDMPEMVEWQALDAVAVEGAVTNTGDALWVRGRVSVPARMVCPRCLQPYETVVVNEFDELYRSAESRQAEQERCETYTGDELILDELIRDMAVTARPIDTVCQPNCRGLCPVCGVNRNKTQCACETASVDPRLARLQQFFQK